MRKQLLGLVLIAVPLALACASCVEAKCDSTVNPDGSTRLTIDALMPNQPQMGNGPKLDPEVLAKEAAKQFLANAPGVDAWKDVSFEVAKDGRTHIKATAYVADLNKSKILPIKWTNDASGAGTLQLVKDQPETAPAAPKNMTDEEVKKKIAEERAKYERAKIFQAAMTSMRIEANYHLPGTIAEANIFTKGNDNTTTLLLEGQKIIDAMDKIMADDKTLAASIRAGKDPRNDDDIMFQAVYGKKGPAQVKVTGATKAQFDYAKEMKAAKEAQPAMLEKLGIDLKPKTVPGGGGM